MSELWILVLNLFWKCHKVNTKIVISKNVDTAFSVKCFSKNHNFEDVHFWNLTFIPVHAGKLCGIIEIIVEFIAIANVRCYFLNNVYIK